MRIGLQYQIGHVTHKDGVKFDEILPGGFAILAAVNNAARKLKIRLVISSGTDGVHSGPTDPHPMGRAYDISIADYYPAEIDEIIKAINEDLIEGLFTLLLESPAAMPGTVYPVTINPGATGPHLHLQTKKGTVFPPLPSMAVTT